MDDGRDFETSSEIIGGNVAEGRFFNVYVTAPSGTPGYHTACGGSMIAPTLLMTAAHCVDHAGEPRRVWASRPSTNDEPPGDAVAVAGVRMWIHPAWNPDSLANDIALIELEAPVPNAETIDLVRTPPETGDVGIASGWGLTSRPPEGVIPQQLMEVDLTIGQLGMHTGDTWLHDVFCSNNNDNFGASTCNGDSGGPFTFDGQLAGVVSFGFLRGDAGCLIWSCYTNVSRYRGWTEPIMTEATARYIQNQRRNRDCQRISGSDDQNPGGAAGRRRCDR